MRKFAISLSLMIALGALALGLMGSETNDLNAQTKVVGKVPVLGIQDLEGEALLFGDSRLKGNKLVFVFLATWSKPSIDQAKEVLSAVADARKASAFDGTLVMVCDGATIDDSFIGSRALREEIDGNWKQNGNVWVTSKHSPKVNLGQAAGSYSSLADKFKESFPDLQKLDRIPAIVISDLEGRVSSSHHGRMTTKAVKALFPIG